MDLFWQGLTEGWQLIVGADPELLQIAALSLMVSLSATVLSALIGIPMGAALAIGRFRGRMLAQTIITTGMGLPPVIVGLVVTMFLWRTGPLGTLHLLYTAAAIVLAQFMIAMPIVAGLTWSALSLIEPEILEALRIDGAGTVVASWELVRAAWPQILVAIAAGFGRAIAEVGASLMVGANIVGRTRILTTAITLETSKGDFSLAIALGMVLLALAFLVNTILTWRGRLVAES